MGLLHPDGSSMLFVLPLIAFPLGSDNSTELRSDRLLSIKFVFVFWGPFQDAGWAGLPAVMRSYGINIEAVNGFVRNLCNDKVKRHHLFKQTILFLFSHQGLFPLATYFYFLWQVQSKPSQSFNRTLVRQEGIRSLGGPGALLTERWGQSTWLR